MLNKLKILLGLSIITLTLNNTYSQENVAFQKEIKSIVTKAKKDNMRGIEGKDGWIFFRNELRSMSIGTFWGNDAINVSRASKEKYADPLPAILNFQKQCKKANVELLIVPVPTKAFIYPDKISSKIKLNEKGIPPRLDIHYKEFYDLLKKNGVTVLDLTSFFLDKRSDKKTTLYCKHDSHWTSEACLLTAKAIKKHVENRPWVKDLKKAPFIQKTKSLEITGDLWRYFKNKKPQKESLPMIFVGKSEDKKNIPTPLSKNRNSPIILMGDSHTMVFNAGDDLHTKGAGLLDHLALEFGITIDQVSGRGSGVTVPRIDLARRRDNLKGKKLIIWCFSARQFTESKNGWMRPIPIVK